MRRLLIILFTVFTLASQARDTLFVQQPQWPILIERHDNVLLLMRIDAQESRKLEPRSNRSSCITAERMPDKTIRTGEWHP